MRVAVLASGTGSNFAALADFAETSQANYEVVGLFCDRPQARVLRLAAERKLPIASFSPGIFTTKDDYEAAIVRFSQSLRADWVALAGYMRILGSRVLEAFPEKIVNIHPSLLPAFPGARAIEQAFDARVKQTGVTIHVVDEGVDTGPILAQQALPVNPSWSLGELTRRVHRVEHELYPRVLSSLGNEKRV